MFTAVITIRPQELAHKENGAHYLIIGFVYMLDSRANFDMFLRVAGVMKTNNAHV